MDWEYFFITNRNLISVRASGKFSPRSFEEMIKDIQSDARWRPGMDRLVDFSSLDLSHTTSYDMTMTADIHRRNDATIGHGRIAVIFGREEDLGLGRMYELLLGSDVQAVVRSFRTADEARQWLAGDLSAPSER